MKPLALVAALLAALPLCAQPREEAATRQALAHFDDIKFGMFIHWGLYALPAGEWKGKYVRGIGEWIMFRERIPVKEYEALAKQFNPTKFNGDAWAQVAADAGMRYLVITSKHHDGFAMYGSKASPYNIVDATPFHRDPMKELSAACARRDIGFGFYYSQDQDWHEAGGRGNNWDFPEKRDAQPYLEQKVFPQVKEILSGYGKLSLIWFDTPGLLSVKQVTDLRAMVKSLQPDCLINSRIGHNRHDYTQTGDNAIPIQVYTQDGKWEVPATLNDTWGYKKNDNNWKDPRDLIAKLADIASKGGNYLLNVGPTAEGVIPQASQDILRTIGRWLKVNGESIYGTRPSPFAINGITWRATVKPGKLYLHILNWPGTKLTIEGLESKVTGASFLANKAAVKYTQSGATLTLQLPAQPVDPNDTVIALTLAGQAARIAPAHRAGVIPARLDLHAWESRLRGEEVRYDWATQSASRFKRFAQESNALWWYPYKALNGNYSVEITYAADNANAGSAYQVSADRRGSTDSKLTATIGNTGGQFVTRKLPGTLTVNNETDHITFALTGDDKSAGVRVRKITLVH
jgi:alpha-L-fucosidase